MEAQVNKLLAHIAILGLLIGCTTEKPEPHDSGKLWFQTEHNGRAVVVIPQFDPSGILEVAKQELSQIEGVDTFFVHIDHNLPHQDGFEVTVEGGNVVLDVATDRGALYGAYYILRQTNIGANIGCKWQQPSYDLRVLNHWDNLDGTVERGYAGRSIFFTDNFSRYEEYARADASVGINVVILNNVNASPEILTSEYISRVKAIAEIFRHYAIRVGLSVNFSSPMVLGGLKDADPLNDEVKQWWIEKVDEIYDSIPDFVGFLVKANSEGLPGPLDYNRSHAEGANMLARALKPHEGFVLWRAFVYSPTDADRAKQAYLEFKPLDGEFDDNVIIQIKNGPVDFQPREPFSPLFGAMDKTNVMAEFQITQEYLGASNHICFLPSLWSETLCSDTYLPEEGYTISKITQNASTSAIAGVANIGDSENWCGNTFAQANWYGFGRLAWNTSLTPEAIAEEWIHLTMPTIADDSEAKIAEMLVSSREIVVNYMMPMGLHHLFAWSHHYGPEPWCDVEGAREDWMPRYYHKADSIGLGFDRSTTGSNAVGQYAQELADKFNDKTTCPPEYLLWFHHIGWNEELATGRTLWQELCQHYKSGLDGADSLSATWQGLKGKIDDNLWAEIDGKLQIQKADARWWHDGCLLYFQQFSKMDIPQGTVLNLDSLKNFHLSITNFECPTEQMLTGRHQ